MNDIQHPPQTVYAVVKDKAGGHFAVEVAPNMVLNLGAGALIVWQGTNREEFERRQIEARVPQPPKADVPELFC